MTGDHRSSTVTTSPHTLSAEEITILKWAAPVGALAIVWPTGSDDSLYLAGRNLERLGLLVSVEESPSQWIITNAGRAALSQVRP